MRQVWAAASIRRTNERRTQVGVVKVESGLGITTVTMTHIPVLVRLSSSIPAQAALFSQSLARSIPGALVVIDNRNRVISWNRAAEHTAS